MRDRISSERVYSGKILNVDRERVVNPAGSELDLEIIRHPGAAAVVPVLLRLDAPDPTILLIKQYRYAAGGDIWEIPAGVLEPGEAPETCARRELQEETGGTTSDLRPLTTILTTPGFTDERIHLFVATEIELGSPSHQPDESIELAPRPMSRVLGMIERGEIKDSKSISALLYVFWFLIKA